MLIRKYELLVGATLALALGLCLPYFISYYVYGDYSGREHPSEVVIPVSGGGLNLPAIDGRTPTPGTPFAPKFVLIATDGPLSIVPELLLPGLATSTPTTRPTSTLATYTPTSRPSRRATATSVVQPTLPKPTLPKPTSTLPPTASLVPTKPPTATPVTPSKTPTTAPTATTRPPTRTPTNTPVPPTHTLPPPPTNTPTDPPPPPTATDVPPTPTDPPPPPTATDPPPPPTATDPPPPSDTPAPPDTPIPPPSDTPAALLQSLPWELGSAKTAREKPLTFI